MFNHNDNNDKEGDEEYDNERRGEEYLLPLGWMAWGVALNRCMWIVDIILLQHRMICV